MLVVVSMSCTWMSNCLCFKAMGTHTEKRHMSLQIPCSCGSNQPWTMVAGSMSCTWMSDCLYFKVMETHTGKRHVTLQYHGHVVKPVTNYGSSIDVMYLDE